MISSYKVVYHTNYDKFITEVELYLKDKWELQGGASYNQGVFTQALKKEPLPVQDEATVGATVRKKRAYKKRVNAKQPQST